MSRNRSTAIKMEKKLTLLKSVFRKWAYEWVWRGSRERNSGYAEMQRKREKERYTVLCFVYVMAYLLLLYIHK